MKTIPHIPIWSKHVRPIHSSRFQWPQFRPPDDASFLTVLFQRWKKPSLGMCPSHKSPFNFYFLFTESLLSKPSQARAAIDLIMSVQNKMNNFCEIGNAYSIISLSLETLEILYREIFQNCASLMLCPSAFDRSCVFRSSLSFRLKHS